MRHRFLILFPSLVAMVCVSALAATYSGNGNSGFGGPIGLGSLTLTDNGTTVSGTVNKGPNGFNDVLVLYIDSVSGGFSDTSGFGDGADGLRRAISGFDGGGNRSCRRPTRLRDEELGIFSRSAQPARLIHLQDH